MPNKHYKYYMYNIYFLGWYLSNEAIQRGPFQQTDVTTHGFQGTLYRKTSASIIVEKYVSILFCNIVVSLFRDYLGVSISGFVFHLTGQGRSWAGWVRTLPTAREHCRAPQHGDRLRESWGTLAEISRDYCQRRRKEGTYVLRCVVVISGDVGNI